MKTRLVENISSRIPGWRTGVVPVLSLVGFASCFEPSDSGGNDGADATDPASSTNGEVDEGTGSSTSKSSESSSETSVDQTNGTVSSSMTGSLDDTGASSTPGCGASPPSSGRFAIDVDGTNREYILTLPENYDPNLPYRLIFGWHPLGGSADQVATEFGGGYYGLLSLAEDTAIFVSPEGIDEGWANPQGRDTTFLRAMLERFRSELCIDETRIFSTGFSYGGMMSFAIACEMGDVFRAIAPMSGALYSGCQDSDHPIAMMGWHGDVDTVVPLGDGESARDVILENSNCGTATVPTEPAPCVAYDGCDAEHPVIWCEFSGGHTPAPNSAQPIWDFFTQF